MDAVATLLPADFQALFEDSPERLFVMGAAPPYPIVAANRAFLESTTTQRESILGKGFFDIFPAHPDDPAASNAADVLTVLERLCRTGETGHFAPYRYDVPRAPEAGGGFEERFWRMKVNPTAVTAQGAPRFLIARAEDITADLRSNAEMSDVRARLEATLGAAEIGTWIWDIEGDHVFADRNLAGFFNVSDADARGGPIEHYKAAIHAEDRDRVTEAIARAVREGQNYEVEYRLVHPDRPARWVIARGWAERDDTGRVRRFPGVVLDITARRRAEESLHENAERLRMATESANLGTWDYFPATGELICSDLCRAMLGLPPGAPVSMALFLEAVHPDERQRTQDTMRRAFQPESGGYFEVDFRAVGQGDAVERWLALMGRALFDQQGRAERFIGTALDITTRKRAEQATLRRSEQLQSLAAASTRLNAAHDVRSVLGIIAGEARTLIGARHAVTTATPAGQPQSTVQPVVVVTPGSEELPVGAARPPALITPLLGHGGQPIGVIELLDKMTGTFTPDDAAVLAQLAQIAAGAIENARLYEELRANDKRKDEFLAMLAHELRNPLAAIRNAVALGSHQADAADVEWSMEVIHRQTDQLNRLIDDLLDVSRITQGMVQLRKETLDISKVLSRAVDAVRGLVDERRHALHILLPADPVSLEGDPVRMEQIFVNLLTNAAKYTDHGGRISLRAARENGQVVVSIRDNGVGIPPDKLPQMFELFAQGNRSLARSEGGLGIGLTVVRSLTQMHGGSIHATSEGPGQGSEFVVRLPAVPAPTPPDAVPVAATDAGTTEEAKPIRVLVVDDNVDSARGTAKILARSGYDVQVAYDGPSAVENAILHQPSFVFLDIGLPGMNGYEVAVRLRQEPGLKEVMLVAVSGYGEEGDRRRSREAGFDQHLVKPVDPIVLLKLMRE